MPNDNMEVIKLRKKIAALEADRDALEQTKRELLASEMEWQTLFDILPVGVFACGEDNTVKCYNSAFIKIFGFSSEADFSDSEKKFIYNGIRFYDENNNPVVFDHIPGVRALNEKKEFKNAEIGMILNDGERKWMSVDAAPLPGTGVVVAGSDITNLKEHQIALGKSRRKYKHLLDTIPYGVVETDCDGNIIYVNASFTNILDCGEDDILHKSLYSFLYPDYCGKDLQNLLEHPSVLPANALPWFGNLKTPSSVIKNIKIDWKHSDGEIGETTGSILVVTDITETKRREEIHTIITRNAQESIVILDEYGCAVFMNQPAMGMVNGDIGMTIWDVFPKEFSERVIEEVRGIFRTGETRSGELKVPIQDKTLWMHVSRAPVMNSIGQVTSVLIIAADITELKVKEQQLIQVKNELERKAFNLNETNIALKVLLEHRNEEIKSIYDSIRKSIALLIQPFLEMLKKNVEEELQKNYLDIIDKNLAELTTTFPAHYRNHYSNLTPTEIHVAKLISTGKTTKDIMEILNISENTVTSHRKHIRKKLGLRNKKKNLMVFLQQIES